MDVPLCAVRPVKTVLLLLCTGDRGLCGGFNNFIIKKTEERVAELEALAARCVGERERRPTFAEIAAEVGEERQHI